MSDTPERLAHPKRAALPEFVATLAWQALCSRLPLVFPTPPGTPTAAKRRYRSAYRYVGNGDPADPHSLARL